MTKKYIKEYLEQIDTYFEGPLEEVISNLKSLGENYTNLNYHNLFIEIDYNYESSQHNLMGERLETDKEYEARINKAKKEKERKKKVKVDKEAQERELLKKLKKKYESSGPGNPEQLSRLDT